MIRNVALKHLTYLDHGALADLALAVREIEKRKIPGMLIEAGTALGGSALVISSAKNPDRYLQLYDTFEMIPAPDLHDGSDAHSRYEVIRTGNAKGIAGDPYYGYQGDLEKRIILTFEQEGFPINKNNITLYKGLIEDTLCIKNPVALAHIDCDWYSPVMTSLLQISSHLSPGGYIVIDDYDEWSGARRAVNEFLSTRMNNFIVHKRTRLYLQYRESNPSI